MAKRYTPAEILSCLRIAASEFRSGKNAKQVSAMLGVSDRLFSQWRRAYGVGQPAWDCRYSLMKEELVKLRYWTNQLANDRDRHLAHLKEIDPKFEG